MNLASYAMKDSETEGRRFPEAAHPYRSDYQRDRDRIIHTKAFRRLEKKTQVFAPDYSDHFRTRLTHTLEVAQVSRTVSQSLGLNADLCEVLALSHDIGHPPFSHEGEQVLDELMSDHGRGFDHNLHALRIVEDFEEKYPTFRGLNLTFEVREGIIKHSRDYQHEEVAYLPISGYRLGEKPPLEAQLIDLADEIAYNSADLDDGYAADLLSVAPMRDAMELFDTLYTQVEQQFKSVPEKLKLAETVRRIINALVTDLISHTRVVLRQHQIETVTDVRTYPTRMVGFSAEMSECNRQIKSFLSANLYDHPTLKNAREGATMQIRDLFNYYLDDPERLPPGRRTRLSEIGVAQAVCDYVAGMTDNFAQHKHQEIAVGAGS